MAEARPGNGGDALAIRWRRLVEPFGADSGAVDRLGADLVARWSQPQRCYHTTTHLVGVLDELEVLCGPAVDRSTLDLAAWFHDAVYEPAAPAGANEEQSAVLARVELGGLGLDRAVVDRVAHLVRLTATHRAGGDEEAAVFLDADLAVLGAAPPAYWRYVADVRREYGFLDDGAWRVGRRRVLETFSASSRLFVSDAAFSRLEAQARRNLAAELATLGGGEPQAGVP